jgi:hypothetical protein
MHTLFTDQSSFTRHYGQAPYTANSGSTTHHYPYDQYTRYYPGSAYGLSASHQSKEMVKPPYSYIALIGEFWKLFFQSEKIAVVEIL